MSTGLGIRGDGPKKKYLLIRVQDKKWSKWGASFSTQKSLDEDVWMPNESS